MTLYKEKRSAERYPTDVPVICSYYNKKEYFRAKAVNCCRDGMCLETETSVRPGSSLSIRVQNPSSDLHDSVFHTSVRTLTLAEVCWCRQTADKESHLFKIGVKYFQI